MYSIILKCKRHSVTVLLANPLPAGLDEPPRFCSRFHFSTLAGFSAEMALNELEASYSRLILALGHDNVQRLQSARILIFGLSGVGAEAGSSLSSRSKYHGPNHFYSVRLHSNYLHISDKVFYCV